MNHFTATVVVSAVVLVRASITFCRSLIMEITDHTAIRSHLAVRKYDGLVMFGYVVFAIVAIAVLYFASGGP